MFGTLVLHGTQQRNLFVAENGMTFKLINSWVIPPTRMEKYILIKKFDDEHWFLLRDLTLNYNC